MYNQEYLLIDNNYVLYQVNISLFIDCIQDTRNGVTFLLKILHLRLHNNLKFTISSVKNYLMNSSMEYSGLLCIKTTMFLKFVVITFSFYVL